MSKMNMDDLFEELLKEWAKRPSPDLRSLMEISFKAGQKSVAQYINKNWSCKYPVGSSGYENWQKQKKKWGVEK